MSPASKAPPKGGQFFVLLSIDSYCLCFCRDGGESKFSGRRVFRGGLKGRGANNYFRPGASGGSKYSCIVLSRVGFFLLTIFFPFFFFFSSGVVFVDPSPLPPNRLGELVWWSQKAIFVLFFLCCLFFLLSSGGGPSFGKGTITTKREKIFLFSPKKKNTATQGPGVVGKSLFLYAPVTRPSKKGCAVGWFFFFFWLCGTSVAPSPPGKKIGGTSNPHIKSYLNFFLESSGWRGRRRV